jgi:amiloride-sensitive sodium channel
VNDPYLRNIDPIQRKCVFPDEPSNSAYRMYSYSTCVTECLKKAQIKVCNCTHYNLIVNENDKSPVCGFHGLVCLDQNDLLSPQTTIMQPWRTDGLGCTCLPSCNEKQINVVGRSSKIRDWNRHRTVSIQLQALPTQRYFRQAVREKIDVVGNMNAHF